MPALIYIVLAIVAGFVALNRMNVPLVLLVLGLIAGIAMPRDRMVLVAVIVIALPIVGTALAHIPMWVPQLTAVAGNLQLGVAGCARNGNGHHAVPAGDGRGDRIGGQRAALERPAATARY